MNTPIHTTKERLITCVNCKCKFNPEKEGIKRKCGMCLNFYYAYQKPKMSDEQYQKILLMANVENIENAS